MPRAGRRDGGADSEHRADDPVTVLAVDDHDSFRAALRDLVDATDGFALVGEVASGEAALEAVDELSPDMVIMDKRMSGIGGIEACRLITERHPEVAVVIISVEDPPDAQLPQPCAAVAFVRKEDLSTRMLREFWRHARPERPAAGRD